MSDPPATRWEEISSAQSFESVRNLKPIVAGLLLLAVTIWAFTGSTNSSGVYNPVLAGEPLPDGFRQLLPRDAIMPIYDPQFTSAGQIGWPADTDVIGVTLGDEAKAYPVSFLGGRELVIDELDGIPILVSW